MNYYITQPTGSRWNYVEASFATREQMAAGALKMLKEANDWESASIALNCEGIACAKRIGVGKSINDSWISGRSKFIDARDPEIREAAEALAAKLMSGSF